jgi:hypothetical protein
MVDNDIDKAIDRLYQQAPGAFTAARNELAARAGARRAEIKALQKPSAAAWAVNQVYWHRRPVFDELASASTKRRRAHVQRLDGQASDLAAADARHRRALEAALTAALGFLKDAGDAATPATQSAVSQTLEAVPSPEVEGRLTRPVEPAGFSALAALVASAPAGAGASGRGRGP